jgi:tRNA threonylcarbamoyladenosine biosynthesis protein TsaB
LPLILNIDTATEFASLCLSNDGIVIGFEENQEQKNHASFLQPAIKKLMFDVQSTLMDLDAIAITNGPGSYTGLRVGLASAKGLCFALNKPLIVLNTLQVMGLASREWLVASGVEELRIGNRELGEHIHHTSYIVQRTLFCPMIDARRLEVFTALYDFELNEILKPAAIILDNSTFSNELANHRIIFSGSGSFKMKALQTNSNISFSDVKYSAKDMVTFSEKMFEQKIFADLAYSTPNYHKEFYTTAVKRQPTFPQ